MSCDQGPAWLRHVCTRERRGHADMARACCRVHTSYSVPTSYIIHAEYMRQKTVFYRDEGVLPSVVTCYCSKILPRLLCRVRQLALTSARPWYAVFVRSRQRTAFGGDFSRLEPLRPHFAPLHAFFDTGGDERAENSPFHLRVSSKWCTKTHCAVRVSSCMEGIM